jgi:nucleoside-diphosphate-sugar epimerase
MAKKHLIIGGLGFLGTEVVRALQALAPADEIHVVDPNWFSAPVPAGITWHNKSAWELERPHLEGFHSLVLLSGLANDKIVEGFPRENFRDNLALPTYIAWLAREAGVRQFLFTSTTSVYESEGDELWTEAMPLKPSSPASMVKWQVERALEAWSSGRFRVFTFRLGTMSGWSLRPRFDLVINTMCKTAVAEGKIRVTDPRIWRSILSVTNGAEVLAETCARDSLEPGTYNLLEGAYTLGEIGSAVREQCRELGISVELEAGSVSQRRSFRADGAKLRKVLPGVAWKKPGEIALGVLTAIRGWSRQELEGDAFYNYAAYLKVSGR